MGSERTCFGTKWSSLTGCCEHRNKLRVLWGVEISWAAEWSWLLKDDVPLSGQFVGSGETKHEQYCSVIHHDAVQSGINVWEVLYGGTARSANWRQICNTLHVVICQTTIFYAALLWESQIFKEIVWSLKFWRGSSTKFVYFGNN